MTWDQTVLWVMTGIGYVAFIAFTLLAFGWTRIISHYTRVIRTSVDRDRIAFIENRLRFSRQMRRLMVVIAVMQLVYGTWILTMALKT